MTDYSRRTHIVRCTSPTDPGTFADVEVMDAISFRIEQNKEVILNFKADNVDPTIIDTTGDGNDKAATNGGTRLSHMQRITDDGNSPGNTTGSGTNNFLDIEVIDACAFRDQNGDEWILDMPAIHALDYNLTDEANGVATGDSSTSTRRAHNELLSTDGSGTYATKGTGDYATIVRSDNIAFRRDNGDEVILSLPSGDDGGPVPRANTFTTPDGYDPTDTSDQAVVPPDNSDPNLYVFFPPGANPATADTQIDQGFMWWIRKVSGGVSGLVFLTFHFKSTKTEVGFDASPPFSIISGIPGTHPFSFDNMNAILKPDVTVIPAIVQPTPSKEMLASLLVWTPTEPWDMITNTSSPQEVWIIDTAAWQGVYHGVQTIFGSTILPYEEARQQLGHSLFQARALDGTPQTDDINPASSPPYYGMSAILDGPPPPSPVFFAAGETAHQELTLGSTLSIEESRFTLILNTNLIKTLDTAKTGFLTFTVDVSSPPAVPEGASFADFDLNAQGFLKKDVSSFPVDDHNNPTFPWSPVTGGQSNQNFGSVTTFTVTVEYATLLVTIDTAGGGTTIH